MADIKELLNVNEDVVKAEIEKLESKSKELEEAKEEYGAVYGEIEEKMFRITEEKQQAIEQIEANNGDLDHADTFEDILELEEHNEKLSAIVTALERQHSNLLEKAEGQLHAPADRLVIAHRAVFQGVRDFMQNTSKYQSQANKSRFKEIAQQHKAGLVDMTKLGDQLQTFGLLENTRFGLTYTDSTGQPTNFVSHV